MKALLLALAINWNADLTQLANELPKTHPNPFRKTTQQAFLADVEQLRARAPQLQPHEVVVDMARIVATIADGHTRLSLPIDDNYGLFHPHVKNTLPKEQALWFHAIPLRFTIQNDALFTIDGRRVARIGHMTAEDAMKAVAPVAPADNDWQRKDFVAAYLSIPEVLHARGVIASLDQVPVTFADGTSVVEKPAPPPASRPVKTPWSFEYLKDEKAVWFDYHEVLNSKNETLASFADRMFRFIDEQPVETLIIDMRDNYGGNNSLNEPLLHGIIRSKELQAPGSLFVLIGRRTFSAATMFAVDLEEHTNAIFLGEPTGGAPLSYGDSKKINLPESGLLLRVSRLYWQMSDPRDQRDTLTPHFQTDDPRAIALDYFGAPAKEGKWEGVVTLDHERRAITIVNGEVVSDLKDYKFDLRLGSKRAAGTMNVNGIEYLVTAERRE